jgi:hypothetical protein
MNRAGIGRSLALSAPLQAEGQSRQWQQLLVLDHLNRGRTQRVSDMHRRNRALNISEIPGLVHPFHKSQQICSGIFSPSGETMRSRITSGLIMDQLYKAPDSHILGIGHSEGGQNLLRAIENVFTICSERTSGVRSKIRISKTTTSSPLLLYHKNDKLRCYASGSSTSLRALSSISHLRKV